MGRSHPPFRRVRGGIPPDGSRWQPAAAPGRLDEMMSKTRKRWLIAGGIVAALALIAGGLLFVFRDRATPAQQEDIEATLVTGAGAPGDYGLYLYATTGF